LPLLDQPLLELLRLEGDRFSGRRSATAKAVALQTCVGVVLAAHGYPGDVRTGDVIHGLDDVARDCPDVQLRFAGVKEEGNQLVTAGGRVLTVVATAPSFEIAIARAYEGASKIKFDGMQYRRDIGRRAIHP
jgi:phosphoribosylamine---glycine ligase